MVASQLQAEQLLHRVVEKTRSEQLRWEAFPGIGANFQTRLGDFVLQLTSLAGNPYAGVQLEIRKLDGKLVDKLGKQMALDTSGTTTSPVVESFLMELYMLVTDSSRELDELIKLLD